MKVLMIDDDVELGEAMRPILDKYGIELKQVETPLAGLEMMRREVPDVLLLDMMLPEMDGMMVCQEIRSSREYFRNVPIVALSARAELTDRIVGLESGIDDYIAKPVEIRELVARLRAVSRGRRPVLNTQPSQGLKLDEARLEAVWDGTRVALTDLEMQILLALQKANGMILSRAEILRQIGHSQQSDPAMIDTIIYRVRQKFRSEGAKQDFIHTVRGRGYRILNGGI